jgi:hypothetical protein
VFSYVSGAGTDTSEKGNSRWARVKGKTENAILNMGFKDAYAFRPGYIQPKKGAPSKTKLYAAGLIFAQFLDPLIKLFGPKYRTTTENIARAMINVSLHPSKRKHLESIDINQLS